MRDYRDLFFCDLFLQRIYLITEDLLAASVFQRTLTNVSPSLSSRPQELCGIYFIMCEDLLKNPKKFQKIDPGSCW